MRSALSCCELSAGQMSPTRIQGSVMAPHCAACKPSGIFQVALNG